MSFLCKIGIHSWKKNDCSICEHCGKVVEKNHDWEGCKCRKCGEEKHIVENCKCKICNDVVHKYDWDGFYCINCNALNYISIFTEIDRIGKKCDVVGFGELTENQIITELKKYKNDKEKNHYLGERMNYLIEVIRQMYDPPITNRDVEKLNSITGLVNKALGK